MKGLSHSAKGAAKLIGRSKNTSENPKQGLVCAAPEATAEPETPRLPPDDKSDHILAVLPFDNVSNDAGMQFFSDGISEDIIHRLVRASQLKIIGRLSSFQFRGDRKAMAAQKLRCSHLLNGAVRRYADRVRISAQLTETTSHTTLWSVTQQIG